MKKFTLNETLANVLVAAYFIVGCAVSSFLVAVA
jgi:hypothetical protein